MHESKKQVITSRTNCIIMYCTITSRASWRSPGFIIVGKSMRRNSEFGSQNLKSEKFCATHGARSCKVTFSSSSLIKIYVQKITGEDRVGTGLLNFFPTHACEHGHDAINHDQISIKVTPTLLQHTALLIIPQYIKHYVNSRFAGC